jgi:hypothetical protein
MSLLLIVAMQLRKKAMNQFSVLVGTTTSLILHVTCSVNLTFGHLNVRILQFRVNMKPQTTLANAIESSKPSENRASLEEVCPDTIQLEGSGILIQLQVNALEIRG